MPGTLRPTLPARALATPVAALALTLAGCGSGDEGSIPEDASNNLLDRLATVQEQVEQQNCDNALLAAEGFQADVEGLRGKIDAEAQEALADTAAQLVTLASDPEQCDDTETLDSGVGGFQPTEEDPVEPTAPEAETTPEEETTDEATEPEQDEESEPEPSTPQGTGGEGATGGETGDTGTGADTGGGSSGESGSGTGNSGGIAPRRGARGERGRR